MSGWASERVSKANEGGRLGDLVSKLLSEYFCMCVCAASECVRTETWGIVER